MASVRVRAERRLDLDLRARCPQTSLQTVEVAFPALTSSGTELSNDLECAGLFDELPQPLHVRRAARPARIVGPAVDLLLRPTVVNRAEVRHSVEHRIVRLSVSKLPSPLGFRFYALIHSTH
jgi:hypothetical protein